MIDADYTAKDRIGTLTVSTDEREVAWMLRAAFLAMRAAVDAGRAFVLTVAPREPNGSTHPYLPEPCASYRETQDEQDRMQRELER